MDESKPDETHHVFFLGTPTYHRWALFFRMIRDPDQKPIDYPLGGDIIFPRQVLIDDRRCNIVLHWFFSNDRQIEAERQHRQLALLTSAAVVVYCISDRQTFLHVRKFMEDIMTKTRVPDVAKLLVGYSKEDIEDSRQVSREEGEAIAREYSCAFLEVSLMNDDDIENIWATIGRISRDRWEKCAKLATDPQ